MTGSAGFAPPPAGSVGADRTGLDAVAPTPGGRLTKAPHPAVANRTTAGVDANTTQAVVTPTIVRLARRWRISLRPRSVVIDDDRPGVTSSVVSARPTGRSSVATGPSVINGVLGEGTGTNRGQLVYERNKPGGEDCRQCQRTD